MVSPEKMMKKTASLRVQIEKNIIRLTCVAFSYHVSAVIRIRDPVPFWPLDPESGMGKKSGSGSGMNNPDHISESLEIILG